MGVAEVKGIQSQHVIAQTKHYVAYDSESGNIFVDDQTLHEVYVAPFDAAILHADFSSMMCSYNRVNGTFACDNESTLAKILRDEIGFQGFVTSDWGAIHGVKFINAGPRHGDARRARSDRPPTPLFLRFPARSSPPATAAMADMMESFFGYIAEEPKPAMMNLGDFGKRRPPEDARGPPRRHRY
jgi:beta-glucosidase